MSKWQPGQSEDEPPLSIEEKRRLFYEAYAATISPEDWRNMDRQDILNLALTGDEPHLLWGLTECVEGGLRGVAIARL